MPWPLIRSTKVAYFKPREITASDSVGVYISTVFWQLHNDFENG
jgi:hypothetical protein